MSIDLGANPAAQIPAFAGEHTGIFAEWQSPSPHTRRARDEVLGGNVARGVGIIRDEDDARRHHVDHGRRAKARCVGARCKGIDEIAGFLMQQHRVKLALTEHGDVSAGDLVRPVQRRELAAGDRRIPLVSQGDGTAKLHPRDRAIDEPRDRDPLRDVEITGEAAFGVVAEAPCAKEG